MRGQLCTKVLFRIVEKKRTTLFYMNLIPEMTTQWHEFEIVIRNTREFASHLTRTQGL